MATYSDDIINGINVALNEATLLGVEFHRHKEIVAVTFAPVAIDENGQVPAESNRYYSSANNIASSITDSLLKNKIMTLITTSNNKYSTKTEELNSLLKQISKNDATLDDHHSVLKIVLTLPIIGKYQDDNKPNKKEFKDLIIQQEKLILRTDSLTPKY